MPPRRRKKSSAPDVVLTGADAMALVDGIDMEAPDAVDAVIADALDYEPVEAPKPVEVGESLDEIVKQYGSADENINILSGIRTKRNEIYAKMCDLVKSDKNTLDLYKAQLAALKDQEADARKAIEMIRKGTTDDAKLQKLVIIIEDYTNVRPGVQGEI